MTIIILILFFLFSFYHQINKKRRNTLLGKILKWVTFFLVTWLCLLPIALKNDYHFEAVVWIDIIPVSYVYFLANLYGLIPLFDKKKKIFFYVLQQLVLIIVLFTAFLLIYKIFTPALGLEVGLNGLLVVLFLFTLIMALVLSWFVYMHEKEKIQKLFYLQNALGKSSAGLQFLRSQINPHFLFNALNTLYGMAIRENAVRTGEGIQKLGDMMRFMLQDNQKDKIPLESEISYLKDYIYLQQLRLAESENIAVNVHISEPSHEYFIAPMLLIPFVENAFKHGIRLQEKSWISIDLNYNGRCLDYEVCNSLHHQINQDTEKEQAGIGLENVKERLKLLYPDKHQLTINESENEFRIRLTLNL